MEERFHSIGRPHWRVDGIGKVTGRARYAADLSAPGMLWGKVLISRRTHARILEIDTSKARAVPGVHAVITAGDLPFENAFGVVIKNQPVLAGKKVRHYGDGVVMVAADSEKIADRALELAGIRYEDLPGVFDPEEAMRPDAPLVHDPDDVETPWTPPARRSDPASPADPSSPTDPAPRAEISTPARSNVLTHHRVRRGDPARGFDSASVVLERTFRTQRVEHAYLEPEAVLAEPTEDGGVRVTGSIQNLFSTRRSLAAVLGLDLARVTVKQATLGGSFGGKDEVMTQMACRAALLARATGRPVKMVNSREQSMAESYKRHPYTLHYRIGADPEGRLLALEARIVADAGAYASMSPFVTWRSAVQATGPYECPNVSTDVFAVYTNNCYTGAMRGFGAPQVNFAIETLMDELAEELDLDPLEIRLRNAVHRGSVTATGQVLDHEVSLTEVLTKATNAAGWEEKRQEIDAPTRADVSRTEYHRRGVGLACSYRGVSLGAEGADAVGAIVSVQSDGSVIVSAGLTDMGQGVSSALSLIAAEVLGVDTRRIRFFNVNTGRVPDSGPTVASRSTLMGGQAAKKAAEQVRDVLFEIAAEELATEPAGLAAAGGRIFAQGDPDRALSFEKAASLAFARGRPLLGFGWHTPPATDWDERTGTGAAYFTFVYSAVVAEVEVDLETGRVDVQRVTAAHDLGRAISPAMVKSQIYGGVAMGVGYALLEEFASEKGVPNQLNFDEYLIPTSLDMPEITPILVENPDPLGPFGAKSIGEPATEVVAPAIVNAVCHALGRRIRELPANLEVIALGRHLRRDSVPQDAAPVPQDAAPGPRAAVEPASNIEQDGAR